MVYLRGHQADFDHWAKLGCKGWDYESALQYFRRMETVPGGGPLRGTDGPMRPAPAAEPNPLSQIFVEASLDAGFPFAADFNAGQAEGAGWHDLSITGGSRQSTAAAYLHPVMGERPNLTVLTGARARKLVLNGDRCTGVVFDRDGAQHTASAVREVIVSAGAIDSPRLLLLSGIGPADELREADVPVAFDLPGVGRNLHDQPLCGVVYEASQPIPPGRANLAETSLLWRSDSSLPGPDMQIMFIHVPFHPAHLSAPANSYTLAVACVPDSRGTVKISSPDPDALPLIDPNYLGAASDLSRLTAGIGTAREIAARPPFDAWRSREVLPGPAAVTGEDLRAFAADGTGTYYHPVGTCAMGTTSDAVVDHELRVHGLRGLRVADASVMPRIVCVNTNAATIMIAEKAADLIRNDTPRF
jgi:choline dehydrogenase